MEKSRLLNKENKRDEIVKLRFILSIKETYHIGGRYWISPFVTMTGSQVGMMP